MSEIDRIMEKLRLAWHNHPNQRLCQLVWNIANNTGDMKNTRDCFFVRNDSFEIALNRFFGRTLEAQKKP